MNVKLRIENQVEWINLHRKLQQVGLLKNVSLYEALIPSNAFPLYVDVDIDPLLKLATNPMARKFIPKIDTALTMKVRNLKSMY